MMKAEIDKKTLEDSGTQRCILDRDASYALLYFSTIALSLYGWLGERHSQ